MGDQPSDRINHDALPTHLLCITQSRRRSTAPFFVVESQQSSGIIYQEAVALKHTNFVAVPTDVDNSIPQCSDSDSLGYTGPSIPGIRPYYPRSAPEWR